MESYRVKVKGLTPLLMHRNPMIDDEQEALAGGKRGDDRYPADKWKSYLYIEGGVICIPESNIRAALEKAGARVSAGGKRTCKQAAVAGIFLDEAFPKLLVRGEEVSEDDIMALTGEFSSQAAAVKELGFGIDVRPATIGTAKHVRCRPRFDVWGLEFDIEYEHADLTDKRVEEIFKLAGSISGIGDWRPSSPKRPGAFGRFVVEMTKL